MDEADNTADDRICLAVALCEGGRPAQTKQKYAKSTQKYAGKANKTQKKYAESQSKPN